MCHQNNLSHWNVFPITGLFFILFLICLSCTNLDAKETENVVEETSPWSWNFSGDVYGYATNFNQYGGIAAKHNNTSGWNGSLETSLDFASGNLTHTLSLNFSTELKQSEDSVSQETDGSSYTTGVDYMLIGKNFILNAGVDFDFEKGEPMRMGYLLWMQKNLWKKNSYRLNVSGWIYYRDDETMIANTNISWKKFAMKGFGTTSSLGAKYSADAISKWLGPALREQLSYKFNNGFSLAVNASAFYGYVLETDYLGGGAMRKFFATGELFAGWKPPLKMRGHSDWLTLYLSYLRQCRHYDNIPEAYVTKISQNYTYNVVKLGLKVDF